MEAKRQVGLSGRTVRPKHIITCGVSGAIQFAAGMKNSENIIAINKDENAAIFKSAHYCIVGDLYEIMNGLGKNGGLLGISGVSNDLRKIEESVQSGNMRAKLSIKAF